MARGYFWSTVSDTFDASTPPRQTSYTDSVFPGWPMQPGDPVEIRALQMTQDIDWSEQGAPSLGAVHWRFESNELGSEQAIIEAYNATVEERLRLVVPDPAG